LRQGFAAAADVRRGGEALSGKRIAGQMRSAQRPQRSRCLLGQGSAKGSNPGKASARFGRYMSLEINQE
jgi:hypothetical protein